MDYRKLNANTAHLTAAVPNMAEVTAITQEQPHPILAITDVKDVFFMTPLQGNDRECFAFIWGQNNWDIKSVPDFSIITALVALCQTRWDIFTAAPLWM